jgi:hypothetical protein
VDIFKSKKKHHPLVGNCMLKSYYKTAYESPSHYQVNIRKDFKGIKPTTIKKMEAI